MRNFIFLLYTVLSVILNLKLSFAQTVQIFNTVKISKTSGNFTGLGNSYNFFAQGFTIIGDLDKDGVVDYASGANDFINLDGVIFILFMNDNQTVKSHSIIGRNRGGLNGTFGSMQAFGNTIVSLGDIDGDGNNDLMVGNPTGGATRGEVYVLLLNQNGTVKQYQIIGNSQIGLTNSASFGNTVAMLGDINKDGKPDVAVWSGGNGSTIFPGIVHILSLNNDGSLFAQKRISSTSGNFTGTPSSGIGNVGSIGDLNQDSVTDIVITSGNRNELWVLFLDTAGTVKSHQLIAQDVGGYTDTIKSNEFFGIALAPVGDMDGDGVVDLAVSSDRDTVDGVRTGRVRLLFMNTNGTVKGIKRIDYTSINFDFNASDMDYFGYSICGGIDINGDFKNDLIIGAPGTNDGGDDKGAIYLLSMDGAVHPAPPQAQWRVNATSGNQNTVFTFTQYSTGFPSQYQWSFTPNTVQYQNGTTDTSANPVVQFTQSATYSVQLKVTNPFSEDSLLRSNYITIQTVGLRDVANYINTITLYPNPATSHVQVQSPVNMQAIYVYDITGKQLLHHAPHTTADELNLSELNTGIYFIHVQTVEGRVVKKFTKE